MQTEMNQKVETDTTVEPAVISCLGCFQKKNMFSIKRMLLFLYLL